MTKSLTDEEEACTGGGRNGKVRKVCQRKSMATEGTLHIENSNGNSNCV